MSGLPGSDRLVVIGDALLDRDIEGTVERICPEAPVPVVDRVSELTRPGGAALAAVLAAGSGHPVTLVTALARDDAGEELRRRLADAKVDVVDLELEGCTPEKTRVRGGGSLMLRIDSGSPSARIRRRRPVPEAGAVLVSDYGRGVASVLQDALTDAARRAPLVWDPHPNGGQPVAGLTLATPNESEAQRLATPCCTAETAATELRERWGARAVAVTLGGRGAVLAEAGAALTRVPCIPATAGDVCGAGDCFAATAATALLSGAGIAEAVETAVETAATFVAAGGAAAVAAGRPVHGALAAVRARGGTLVAAGGCFDLIHPGHVRMLQSARALGDHLVVLLNSDDSVRRLKGPDRPLVPQDDRAAVLRALGCVDEVVVFDEDTPAAALEQVRPDIFVKGGDYAPAELPEARIVEAYGGEVVIVPYVEGRSTTRLLTEAAARGG